MKIPPKIHNWEVPKLVYNKRVYNHLVISKHMFTIRYSKYKNYIIVMDIKIR